MTTQTNPQVQDAENKLTDTLKQLRGEPNEQSADPQIEIIPENNPDVEVQLDDSGKKEPRRSEFVQTDDPKVQERINDLYRQVKGSDNRNQLIMEHNRVLERKLEEYTKKFEEFEKTTKRTASSQVEAELKTRLRQAREEQNLDAIEQIEDRLLDLRLEQRISDKIPQPQPTNPQIPPNPQLEKELLRNAAYIEIISQEKDTNGQLVRDYLFDSHPDNWKAVQMFESLPKEFVAAGKKPDIKLIMDTIHERIKGRKSQPNVLSGNGDDVQPKRTIKLTQEQVHVARKMGISPEAYARQLQHIN